MPAIATERVLGLRTCGPNGESNDGRFRWPLEIGATVEAPDWNPAPECGGGLHFLPWGEGDGWLLDWSEDAHWLVIETQAWIRIDEKKAKCQSATVRFVGRQVDATDYLLANGAYGRAVTGANVTAGHHGTATAGYGGTATAGNYGTAAAGHRGTATAGDHGTATAGDHGTATAGHHGTATAGYGGTAAAGDHGTAAAGDHGTATAGDHGTATAGDHGTATAGDHGTATAGHGGTAAAGEFGTIIIRWHDGRRYRSTVGYVGEDGIEAGTPYRCDEDGSLVKAWPETR